jgi:hypothetical protein
VIAGTALLTAVSIPLSVLVFASSPLVFYRKWVSMFRANRDVEVLSYPYVHFAEDVATNVGLIRGAISRARAEDET